ncbi:DUF4350 domain-containing protein [Leifsonia shinshuensis]|uniref:DUF4350 domain-containing protein n=1 Tax=Leifsonia shinshuensis TaxID=150026 RepID=A0A853CX14_9MICO|nr:DUF4350 domain-containing protein [Leifsonia shinshuensis]NYJ25032.1 hypothetical protein [Leifsonia shinshuensis]
MTGTFAPHTDRPAEPDVAPAVSPTVRRTARRAVPWIVLAAIAVLVALSGLLLNGGGAVVGDPLSSTNPGPAGGRAIAQVLGQHGVTVRTAGTLDEVRSAAGDDTTVLVFDPQGNLDRQGYEQLSSIASTIVLVEPDFAALQALAPGVHAAGATDSTATAGCDLPAARRAGSIDPRPTADTDGASSPGSFRATGDATACFESSGGRAALVSTTHEGRNVHLLGSASVLMNDGVERLGNAALGLGLLGDHRTLVWYLPGLLDRPVTGAPDLASLTPGWVTPVVILLTLVFLAAAIWRGRRFGPLVVEHLPVVVRAGETREGRARLYQRSSARLRAADALRIGAIGRLAGLVGLPRVATTEEVADAVAAITGRDRPGILFLLLEQHPRSDRELIALSDGLAELERATADAASPHTPRTTGRMEQ